jgi:hypothetical protein
MVFSTIYLRPCFTISSIWNSLSNKSYENDQQDATVWDNLLFHCFLTAQHGSSDIIFHHQELLWLQLLILHTFVVSGRCRGWVPTQPWQRPATTNVCKTRSCNCRSSWWWAIISLETCWAVKKQWNNKLSYTVASCMIWYDMIWYDMIWYI